MRFLEALLIAFVAIYVAHLVIASLIIATLMLFLWCLYKRPKEALVLGLAILAVAALSKPIGLALVLAIAVGLVGWAVLHRIQSRRRGPPQGCMPLLTRPDRGGG